MPTHLECHIETSLRLRQVRDRGKEGRGQLKTRNAMVPNRFVFERENKQREEQSHKTFGYFSVQNNIEPHPSLKV
jgi:hypothetical protein